MGTRKLIQFGTNSFVISLPKDWLMRHNLKKGNEILVEESSGRLIVAPSGLALNKEVKIKKLHVDETKRRLQRRIISAYINNYNIIEVYGQGLKDHIDDVDNTTKGLVALEIMEQTPKKIIIKDFLNTQDISMQNIINRMDIIIRAMLSDVSQMIEKKDILNLDKRDIDVNRLFYVGQKLINKVLENPSLSKSLDIDLKETMYFYIILDALEKIADQQKRLVRYVSDLDPNCIARKNILLIYNNLIKDYTNTIRAFYHKNRDDADEILNKKESVLTECDNIIGNFCTGCPVQKFNLDPKVHQTSQIIEKFKGFENYISQIAKAVISKD